jgi:hypothetical protein
MSQEFWHIVLAAVLSNAVALAALGFLFKSLTGHLLDKDINNYKSKLEAENLKLHISYGGIFEKQAEAIISIYSKLLSLELGANAGSLSTPAQWNAYRDSIQSTSNHYHEQRVLIPKELDEKIMGAIQSAIEILVNSTSGRTPDLFAEKFREAKNCALLEMRKLLSVGAKESK